MIFELKPISVNKAWRGGRRFKTKDYLQFEKDFSTLIKLKKLNPVKGEVMIVIGVVFKNKRSDIDNIVKPILDILVKNQIIEDDKMVMTLHVNKFIGKDEQFIINILEHDKTKTIIETNR